MIDTYSALEIRIPHGLLNCLKFTLVQKTEHICSGIISILATPLFLAISLDDILCDVI